MLLRVVCTKFDVYVFIVDRNDSVESVRLCNDSVESVRLCNDSVESVRLCNDSLESVRLCNDSVESVRLCNDSVESVRLCNDSVESVRLFRLMLQNYINGFTNYIFTVVALCFMTMVMETINKHKDFIFRTLVFIFGCSVCSRLRFSWSIFAVMFPLISFLSFLYVPCFPFVISITVKISFLSRSKTH
jgi:hypothetical protein